MNELSILHCRMAGIQVVTSGWQDGLWYRCSDGYIIEPLDAVHLLFPNKGRNVTGSNVCFVPKTFGLPLLENLLPPANKYFTPDELVDGVMALAVLCLVITVGMIVSKTVWSLLDPQFALIHPPHKQWYVVANLSKALFLGIFCFSSRYWIGAYREFYLDEFQMVELKRCMMVYVATDVVALYLVPKLPKSTILHHVATATLCVVVSGMNISLKGWNGLLGVCKMSVLYGTFSSVSFSVNAYLALRVVYPKAKWLTPFVKFSLWTYIVCCTGNWTIHGLWLAGVILNLDISLYPVLYLVVISAMVHDDIVLIKWLMKRSSPMATVENETIKDTKKEE